jgi:hypothetical protein
VADDLTTEVARTAADDKRRFFADIAKLRAERDRFRAACQLAVAYDEAIRRHADTESWVASDELDALYADWVNAARSALGLSPLAETATTGPDAVVLYTNYKGETSWRRVVPLRVRYGSNEWHPEPQWLLDVWDSDKAAERTLAMKDCKEWRGAAPEAGS